MLDKKTAINTLLDVIKLYPRHHERKDPFFVLISTVLSQRTRDANTDKASRALFEKFPTAYELSKAEKKDVEKLIKPAGMYKQKAERIVEIAKEVIEKYNGKVPNDLKSLLTLKGVGRKTANIVLAVSFDIPAIAVDVHVHRITNRMGIVKTNKPEETEVELMKILPKKYWTKLNGALVNFGQQICTPRNPKCAECMFREVCEYGRRNGSEVSEVGTGK
ncbi:endonuclease III [Mesoaciditoga lauensis]|uniref:endonuclease III n=1 Tax=Mesoaciditoga lauensis TaxID=1495039 RepID=UPI000569DD7C|nr:endonuclease III [Mesoaciditoga lauensis]